MVKTTIPTLSLMALIVVAGCGGGTGTAKAAAGSDGEGGFVLLEEDLATARRADLSENVVLTGSLEPYRVVNLAAQVPGTVLRLLVDRGTSVRQGEVLAVLDAEGIRGMASAAASQLAVAEHSLEGARTLYEAGAMSELDYESAQAGLDAARAAASGAAETARRATITSPLAGVVSARWVSEGEPVNPGQPVLTVVDTRVLELRGQLPVEEATRVRPGQPVSFEVSGYPDRVFEGEVVRLDPTADAQTRQVGVYARLDNTSARMPGGMFARGQIAVERLADVVVVPQSALRTVAGGPALFVVVDGAIRVRPVTPGPTDRALRLVAILAGLEAGERVLTTPGVDVADGTRIEVAGTAASGEH